uniref:Putative secreted protein n=1 Tax=Anopheles darlingi TaxID=43151 RepID=A0A2M4D155_ANODA
MGGSKSRAKNCRTRLPACLPACLSYLLRSLLVWSSSHHQHHHPYRQQHRERHNALAPLLGWFHLHRHAHSVTHSALDWVGLGSVRLNCCCHPLRYPRPKTEGST